MTSLSSISCGRLLTPTRQIENCVLHLSNGRVASITPAGNRDTQPVNRLDAGDAWVIPGLVDLQVNGALGWSFQAGHADHFEEILAYHHAAGTTTLLPTLITAPAELLCESLRALAGWIDSQGSVVPGIHLEGPFLNPEKSGAHDKDALRYPDEAQSQRFWQASNGKLKMVTLAPELPGADAAIRYFATRNVVVSAGHSAATYADLRRALQAGLQMVTHAGNASDWPHRAAGELGFMTSQPGMVGTLMAEEPLAGSIILDGFHFHPALVAPLLRLKGPDRLLLVSDASTVAGCQPGEYASGGLLVTIHPQGFATSGRGGGWLAGSIIPLLTAVQRTISQAGITARIAVHMATLGPARMIGIAQRKGHLEPGADADLLVLNNDFSLRHVVIGGRLYR